MPEIEYNNLLYQISKRLDELDVGEQLLFLCRGKVTARSEENIQARSLFEELEEKGFLSPDHLVLLKGMLKGVNEWDLFEEVEKFETKRKEYNNLLEQIIRVLDELNDLERLVSICGGKIAEERQGNVLNVRSLFEELEENDWLGIDCLDTLKEILTLTEKSDLLKEVEEFEQRRSRENKFRKRKAQAASFVSSVSDKLSGVLNIKTVFKVVGGITIASTLSLLTRDCTYDQLTNAINTCVLPAGANLIQISEGCVCLKVQVKNLSALEDLWRLYKVGTLRASVQALFVTDEMRELAGGGQVEVDVTIDEEEYEKARNELSTFREQVLSSDEPDGQEERKLQYLDQEKLSYITNYLEQTRDTDVHSLSTEDDSGKAASNSAPSEFGFEETIVADSTSKLCLKDLSMELTEELTSKLNRNKDVLNRFYRSFGLDPDLLHGELDRRNIGKIFPDTPVKLLKEVFEALKLYDFAEFLEKATKPRTLRPALPLKEIEKLSIVSNRPTKVYSKAKVLIIDVCEACETSADNDVDTVGSFFKAQNSRNEVTTLKTDSFKDLLADLNDLTRGMRNEERDDSMAQIREEHLKRLLENKIPDSWIKSKTKEEIMDIWSDYDVLDEFYLEHQITIRRQLIARFNTQKDEQLSTLFSEEEPGMRNELKQLTEKREQWKTERKPLIEKQIKEKVEELKKETEKFEMAVLSVIDKWIELHPNDEGKASTLFVVLIQNSPRLERTSGAVLQQMIINIKRCLSEKLALIPDTKVVIANNMRPMREGNISSETLEVYLSEEGVLTTLLQLLSKRLDTLDLISVMQELRRTVSRTVTVSRKVSRYRHVEDVYTPVQIRDNLSTVPRLQKTE